MFITWKNALWHKKTSGMFPYTVCGVRIGADELAKRSNIRESEAEPERGKYCTHCYRSWKAQNKLEVQ